MSLATHNSRSSASKWSTYPRTQCLYFCLWIRGHKDLYGSLDMVLTEKLQVLWKRTLIKHHEILKGLYHRRCHHCYRKAVEVIKPQTNPCWQNYIQMCITSQDVQQGHSRKSWKIMDTEKKKDTTTLEELTEDDLMEMLPNLCQKTN